MDTTSELRYITEIPHDYQPLVYLPRRLFTKFLEERHIINLSNYHPTPSEIEVLALNLNFITDQKLSESTVCKAIDDYFQKMDRLIFFNERPNKQPRGRIGHLFKKPWQAPSDDWNKDPAILSGIQELRETVSTPANHATTFPKELREAIKSLRSNPEIYITKADKGGATVLWGTMDYIREATRQLSDKSTYKEIPEEQLTSVLSHLNDTKHELANWLHALNRISDREIELILESTSSLSPIYFLPKIHKKPNLTSKTFPGRPIVATFNFHLHWFDKYITEITNDLHHLIPHALIDTLHLLEKLENRNYPLPEKMRIFSADVQSLYPSIDWTLGIEAATRTFTRFHSELTRKASSNNLTKPPTPAMFKTLLTYIIQNSYIHFQNKKFYHQITGTAMGMCISVFFARSFMSEAILPIRDNPPLHLHTIEIFLDDIYIESTGTDAQINEMMESISTSTIKYDYDPPTQQCNMLDLTICIKNGRFITKNYTKPTASPFYLHAQSMHPQSTINSIPFAQLLRIRRNSTFISDFFGPAKRVLKTLKLRGYPRYILEKALNRAISTPRYQTLRRRITTSSLRIQKSIKLILPFNHGTNYKMAKKILLGIHQQILEHYQDEKTRRLLQENRPQIINSNMATINTAFSTVYKNGPLDKI